jgi:hypothetical protein
MERRLRARSEAADSDDSHPAPSHDRIKIYLAV